MCCVNPKSDIGLLSHLADGTPEGGLTVSDRDVAGELPGGQEAGTGTPGTLHHPAEKTHRYKNILQVQKYFSPVLIPPLHFGTLPAD